MRRRLLSVVLVLTLVVTGCSNDLDPIVGHWETDGPQPEGFRDFGDNAEIIVLKKGTASLGRADSMSLCGGASVKVNKVTDDQASYRIVLPENPFTWCLNDVPQSLDVVVKRDALEATPTDSPTGEVYRFKRVVG